MYQYANLQNSSHAVCDGSLDSVICDGSVVCVSMIEQVPRQWQMVSDKKAASFQQQSIYAANFVSTAECCV